MFLQNAMNQAMTRQLTEFEDQHGRLWNAQTDNKTRHPCGKVSPQFYAPWYPEDTFFVYHTRRQNTLTINYEAMVGANIDATRAYLDLCHRAAVRFNVQGWDPKDGPTTQMKHDIGLPPLPIGELAKACQAKDRHGNPAPNGYILGLRPYDPSRASDVKLRALIEEMESRYRVVVAESTEYADESEYADAEQGTAPVVETAAEAVAVPVRRRGRPTNAERAARQAETES